MTRDVGTQSTPVDLSSSSPSPAPTPSIEERSIKLSEGEGGDSPVSSGKLKSETEVNIVTLFHVNILVLPIRIN